MNFTNGDSYALSDVLHGIRGRGLHPRLPSPALNREREREPCSRVRRTGTTVGAFAECTFRASMRSFEYPFANSRIPESSFLYRDVFRRPSLFLLPKEAPFLPLLLPAVSHIRWLSDVRVREKRNAITKSGNNVIIVRLVWAWICRMILFRTLQVVTLYDEWSKKELAFRHKFVFRNFTKISVDDIGDCETKSDNITYMQHTAAFDARSFSHAALCTSNALQISLSREYCHLSYNTMKYDVILLRCFIDTCIPGGVSLVYIIKEKIWSNINLSFVFVKVSEKITFLCDLAICTKLNI